MAGMHAPIRAIWAYWPDGSGWTSTHAGKEYMGYAAHYTRGSYSMCLAFDIESYSGASTGQSVTFSIGSLRDQGREPLRWMISPRSPSEVGGYLPSDTYENRMAWGIVRTGGDKNWAGSTISTNSRIGGHSSLYFAPNTRYYLYLYVYDPGHSTGYQIGGGMSYYGVTFYYNETTAVGRPTNFRFSTTSPYYDTTVGLFWNAAPAGINNPVSRYIIRYSVNGGSWREYSTSGTELWVSNTSIGAHAGYTVRFTIQAIGSKPGFDSDDPYFGSYTVANKPPTTPYFELSGVVRGDGTGTPIKVLYLSASDIDSGDTVTYRYKISSSPSTPSPSGSSWVQNGSVINMSASQPYMHIWSWDGHQYGPSTYRKVGVNTPPRINAIYASGENIKNAGGQNCTRTLSLSASVSKSVSYEWHIWSVSQGKYIYLGDSSSISTRNIESYVGTPGGKIEVLLKVRDSVGDHASQGQFTNMYLIPAQKSPSIGTPSRTESVNGSVSQTYINRGVKVRVTSPTIGSGDLPIKAMEVLVRNRSTGMIKPVVLYYPPSGDVRDNYFEYDFEHNVVYDFMARMFDTADRISTSSWTADFRRLPTLSLANANNGTNLSEWHIFKDGTFQVSTLYPDNANIGKTTYHLQASVNSRGFVELATFQAGDGSTTVDGSTITYTNNTPIKLFEKLGVASNQSRNTITYRILAYNAFNVPPREWEYGYIRDKALVSAESPYFESDANFTLRIGYSASGSPTPALLQAPPIPVSASNFPKQNMFNRGEVLQLSLSQKAKDYNERYYNGSSWSDVQSLQGYHLEYITSDTVLSTLPTDGWKNMTTLSPYSNFIESGGRFIWNFIIPDVTNNKQYVYFRLYAKDKEGNTSGIINYSIPLVSCRKITPNVEIEDLAISNVSAGQTINIKFRINDYGGNEKTYENFTRLGTEKAYIRIEYGSSLPNLDYVENLTYVTSKDLPIYKEGGVTHSITLNSKEKFTGKVYFRIIFSFDTNQTGGDYNKTITPTISQVFYSDGPTVSHRPHWVGVNSTDFASMSDGGKDVIQVASFKDRSLIKLKGEKGDQAFEIVVDLNSGSVSGATINGGSWE